MSERSRRRTRWLLAGGAVLTVGVGGGLWYRSRPLPPPEPPLLVAVEGADLAVMTRIERARQKLLAAPTSADAWGEYGMVLAAHDFTAESDRCFEQATRIDPDNPRWPYFRGIAIALRRPDVAVNYYRQALGCPVVSAKAATAMRLKLAESLLELQQYEESERLFQAEIPEARARYGLARIAWLRGDTAQARKELEVIRDVPFVKKRSAILLASIDQLEPPRDRSPVLGEDAAKLPDDPSWPDPYLEELKTHEVGRKALIARAQTLEAAGQIPAALDLMLSLIETDPDPQAMLIAGVLSAKLGQFPRSEAILRDALKRDPDDVYIRHYLAAVLIEQGQGKDDPRLIEALEQERQAVNRKPDFGMAWLTMGRIEQKRGNTMAAREAMQKAIRTRPDLMEAYLELAEIELQAGRDRKEVEALLGNAAKLAKPGEPRVSQLREKLSGMKSSLP